MATVGGEPGRRPGQAVIDKLFHEKLLDSMHDGVIFVDTQLNILLWNRAAEQLTGLAAAEDAAPAVVAGVHRACGTRTT